MFIEAKAVEDWSILLLPLIGRINKGKDLYLLGNQFGFMIMIKTTTPLLQINTL